MPPGTGDVQLTICQELDLSGAVGVTTPSKLAIADARKGIEMFSSIGIPTLALVENMAYFEVRNNVAHSAIRSRKWFSYLASSCYVVRKWRETLSIRKGFQRLFEGGRRVERLERR